MKTFNGIAMTDEVNLKGHIFPVETIYNAYFNSPPCPTPSFANHDHTKLIGYTELSGIYCQPGKAFLLNKIFFPENENEHNCFPDAYDYLYKERYVENKCKYDKLKELLGHDLTEEAVPCWVNAVSFFDRNIIKRVLPELISVDDDGLIDISVLSQIKPGIYKKGSYLVFAHHYFRRGFSRLNTLNQEFLDLLYKTKSETQCSVKVAIDYDMIGMVGTESEEFEYSYWWGPKFNDSIQDIPYGVTKHVNDKFNSVFSDIRWTEFGFYEQDSKQTFECEEVTDSENILKDGESYSGCRFVHSMFKENTDLPEHLDGAIRAYTEEKMCLRLDVNIDKSNRDTEYEKLWRIDGVITVIRWKELITHYFRDNMLIGEYFGGEDDKLVERTHIPDLPQAPVVTVSDFIPVKFAKGDGLRLAIKRIPVKSESNDYQVYVRSHSCIQMLGESIRYYEAEAITLIKLLKRKGLTVRTPYMKMIEFGDTVTNMPIFECSSVFNANLVFRSFFELCTIWNRNKDDRLASITVKIRYGDWFVLFSFAGHVADFLLMFYENAVSFPELSGVSKWLDKFHADNKSIFGEKFNPTPFHLYHNNGVLAFTRHFVKKEYIDKLYSDNEGIMFNLKIPFDEALVLDTSEIRVAPVYEIKNETCTGCGKKYETCDCVKLIDDTSVDVNDATMIGLIWTERHAWDGIEPIRMKKTKWL